MRIVFSKKCLKYKKQGHPETPERIKRVYNSLKNKFAFSKPEKCTEKDLLLCHTKNLVNSVKQKNFVSTIDNPKYKNIYQYACLSVGSAIKAMDHALNGKNVFSLMRPPGHHAGRNFFGGFCYFNNLAIAVRKSLEKYKNIAIIDFDCHFGNGTADIFYNSKNVLYFSAHQWPGYPGAGWINEIGEGEGRGYTINMPLPQNTGDDIYIKVMNAFLHIIKEQFKPGIVAISAGFDAHESDPITNMNLSSNVFYEIGKMISGNFKRFFVCLEGGYNLDVLPICVLSFLNGISKKENEEYEKYTISEKPVRKEYKERFNKLKGILSDHWEF